MIPPIARRFVAGEHRAGAVDRAAQLNESGRGAIINLLGEHYDDPTAVTSDVEAYLALVDDLAAADLDAAISVKPTQLGLDIQPSLYREQLERIVEHAQSHGIFVWIDMESAETTTPTLEGFRTVAETYPDRVGVCLQANLRRTRDDIVSLANVPGRIRFVKGAYSEPPEIAYQSKRRVDEAYRAGLEALFRTHQGRVAVATHDPAMIEYAIQLHEVHGTPFEFQMLMGVAEDRQRALAADYRVVQYVPYGSRWLAYFTRRVFERTENLTFALRAILGR